MRKRFVGIYIVLFLAVIFGTIGLYMTSGIRKNDTKEEQLISLNEIERLLEKGEKEAAVTKIGELTETVRNQEDTSSRDVRILWVGAGTVLCMLVLGGYIYLTVLRPLKKISQFASEIAKGNVDIPLQYDRGSEVGEFSWAFDSMRKDLKKARAAEKEAIENNKMVIATLSHDIKTPITSIRAYAEGLEANLDSSPEKRAQYLQVIMKKSDEVSKVTDDLLLHSLSDMHRLKVEPREIEIRDFIQKAISDLDPEGKDVVLLPTDVSSVVLADPDRLLQCVENLITNAGKYAETKVEVSLEQNDSGKKNGNGEIVICIRDFGCGIPDEDMPFIFDKFYRGHNHGSKPGSGLGLYIVKYLMTQMDGEIELQSRPDGLRARLILPEKQNSTLRTS